MAKREGNLVATIMGILLTMFALFVITIGIVCATNRANTVEVETYTVGCEVSQMSYAEKSVSRARSRAVYKMGVRNDDFATTFEINASDFARYVVGDVVEIEVIVLENPFDGQWTEYRLMK